MSTLDTGSDASGPAPPADRAAVGAMSGGAATVSGLLLWEHAIQADRTTAALDAMFVADRKLPGVVVTQDDRLVGLVSRKGFQDFVSRPFARDVYAKRKILAVEDMIDPAPLVLATTTPIPSAVALALARPDGKAFEPLLVADDDGPVRLLEMDELLRAQTLALERALAEKEHLILDRERSADALRATLADLRNAQSQLVQAEKMAALGQLVAGVAHEINTPIGVTMTAASTLQDETRRVVALANEGAAKKSDVMRYLSLAAEISELMMVNCASASGLIQSFKRVAVDQSNQLRERFRVRAYLDGIVASLRPTLKREGHEVTVTCPDDLVLDSFPGAFSQVITNLVVNSTVHAWAPGQAGVITIDIAEAQGRIAVRFADDGRGIPAEHRPKIFDPFFTTRRGSGGSGLGLHIVHNIVLGQLKGSIAYVDRPEGGACFEVNLPVRLE